MKHKVGIFCMFLGTVLVFLALSLFLYNQWDAKRAQKASAVVLKQLEKKLDKEVNSTSETSFITDPYKKMKTVKIGGYEYIGYLSIPSAGLNLPVMSKWSYAGLKIAPGRFSGSVYMDNMVIAGHNYARHFSPIKWLAIGSSVYFTDMEHVVWKYKVVTRETLQPVQVKDMTIKTKKDSWDLTLFTCNTGGQTRCAVRCIRIR